MQHRDHSEINKKVLIAAIKIHLQKIADATKFVIKKYNETRIQIPSATR
jgi:hypothetical protein